MFATFYEQALAELRKCRKRHESALVEGCIREFETYRYVCGEIHGLLEAEDALKELFNRWQNTGAKQKEIHAQLY